MERKINWKKYILITLGVMALIALIALMVGAILSRGRPKDEAIVKETAVESSAIVTEQKEIPKSLSENILSDVNNLKDMDKETIARYFGESVGLDRSLFSQLSLKILEESPEEVNVEIVNLDFNRIYKLRSEYSKQVKESNVGISDSDLKSYVDSSLKEQIQKEDYTAKWLITIKGKGNNIIVTEDLKKALTGGWYNSLGCNILPIKQ